MGKLKKGGADKIVMVSGVEPWMSTSDNHSSTSLRMTVFITFFSWPLYS
jgi:hypothetical protein